MEYFQSKKLTDKQSLNLTNTLTYVKRQAKKDKNNKCVYVTFLKSSGNKNDVLRITLLGNNINVSDYIYNTDCGFTVKIISKNIKEFEKNEIAILNKIDLLSSFIIYDETMEIYKIRDELKEKQKKSKYNICPYKNLIKPSKSLILEKRC